MVTGLPTSSLDWRIMGLADDLTVVRREPKLCPFGRLLHKLDKSDRVALERVVTEIQLVPPELRAAGHGTVTIKWMHDALRKNGFHIGRQSINDHLKGACCCGAE
jgi:hypothetical protein